MRAFVLTRYGGPQVAELRDVAVPEPGPGELQIAVKAAGLNPVDFKIRKGELRVIASYALPKVFGCELSGAVTSVGAGVSRFRAGDEVFTRVAKDWLETGVARLRSRGGGAARGAHGLAGAA